MVPTDKKSCPLYSKEMFGRDATPPPQAKPRSLFRQRGLFTIAIVAGVGCWIWSGLAGLKAYDLQAIPREKANLVQIGMTHRQVVDLVGRDAVPIPTGEYFKIVDDQSIRAISSTAKSTLETRKISACSPDRDEECGAHYTLKDGAGLRIIYRRGIVFYTAIAYGSGPRDGRYRQ